MKISEDTARRYADVGRNDPDEAEAIIAELIAELGFCPASMAHYLFMLQDDDDDLRRRVTGLAIKQAPGEAGVA